MFSKDTPTGQDKLDSDHKLYQGLWTLSLVLAEIAKEGSDSMRGHEILVHRPWDVDIPETEDK